MSPVVLVLILVGAFAYTLWESRRDAARRAAGPGISRHPHVPVIDAGGTRVIDLRHVPRDVLASSAGLAWGLEARRPLPPAPFCVWVVPDEVLDGWLGADEVVWVILAERMKALRKLPSPPAIDALYVPEGRFTKDALARPKRAGLTVVHDVTVLGASETTDLQSLLAHAPPAPTGRMRPPLAGARYGSVEGVDYVWATQDLAFVDLRRASVASLESLAVFAHVDRSLAELDGEVPLVWVLAPWVLQQWSGRHAEVLARLAESMQGFQGAEHRLATDGELEPAFVAGAAALGLHPMDGVLGIDGPAGSFTVPVLDALRDLQLELAIPEETRRQYGL